jgi:deoxyribodipyrimidine photolyase-related protein
MPAEKTKPAKSTSSSQSAGSRLGLILGDQLDRSSALLSTLSKASDPLLFIESSGEAAHVWSHKARIALFFSAMRHFAQELRDAGWQVMYLQVDSEPAQSTGLIDRLAQVLVQHKPQELVVVEPGEWRLLQQLQDQCAALSCPLRVLQDTHFLCSREEFARWAGKGKSLRMEFFYRQMRKRDQVLMRPDGEPEGGQWNYDAENRKGFPKAGPGKIPAPSQFAPDSITQQVCTLVEQRFAKHPGSLEQFAWPVTREQALEALARFIDHRLPNFGDYQDAMWTDEAFGWHALLSSSLNLKLLHPREVVDAAQRAYHERKLPLASVEGFIRQVLGWREFIRGVYWLDMPGLGAANHYGHQRALPSWYWTGKTQMRCMQQAVGQTLRLGYAHHIQRLMVTGNFALLAQIEPQQVCAWYLAVYVDAVEWVELPNTAGMALFANGGRFTSKPYIASGAYIKRMSNYCDGCAYKPEVRVGPKACPVTTLYWAFLDRHEKTLVSNPRTMLMARNIQRLEATERQAIRDHAARTLESLDTL